MKTDKNFISILITNIYITIVIVVAVLVVVKLNKVSHEQYKNLDGYYELLIENAVLKERLENELTMNDLDDLMEWTIRYYEVEAQALRDVMLLDEYIKWKDPELYDKVESEAIKWEEMK